MASKSENSDSVSLGVGNIVGESFSILFGNLIAVIPLVLVPVLLSIVIASSMVGADVALGVEAPDFSTFSNIAIWALMFVVQIVFYALATALLVQLTYDAKLGRPLQPGRYISPALRSAILIAVLTIISSVLVGLASIALIIPGLWVYAVFSMIVPAVLFEGAWFRGLRRSAMLTKGYRWPICGVLLLIGVCAGTVSFLASVVASFLVDTGDWAMIAAFSAIAVFAVGLAGISIALIYARLREIKEGVSVDKIVSVFD
ncbi:hypothetical protein [uncultured Tateyamaria sp.]|uniref:hypothetical protein n=1 Tax=uncultured Tateyamaria sp. TaxID=455651 RepID=UPI002604673E|nr:hypothetical protein [uncultured Tateyamaria sp.]